MRTRMCLCMLAGLLLAACGPVAPIQTDVKQDGQDVFFGVPTPKPAPSLPPLVINLNPVQTFPTLVEQPPAITPIIAPPANPCPTLSPLAVPAVDAGVNSTQPPAAATYPFTYQGSITTNPGTPTQKVTQLPTTGSKQVTNVSPTGTFGDYSFDVVDSYNNVKTTTSYHVYPVGVVPPQIAGAVPQGAAVAAGVYVTEIVTTNASGSKTETFDPGLSGPGVEIFPFPATPGATYTSEGTDPLDATTMVVGPTPSNPSPPTVVGLQNVNACGTAVDSWEATLEGTIAGAAGGNTSGTFTLTINMATQYGGLVVSDLYSENYIDVQNGNVPTMYTVGSTINVVPNPPS